MTTFVTLSQDTEGAVSSASLGDWMLAIIKIRCPTKTASYYSQLLNQFQEIDGEQVIRDSFQIFELLLSENEIVFEFLQDAHDNGVTTLLSVDQTSKVESEVKIKFADALKQVEEYFTVLMYMMQLRFTSSTKIEKAGQMLIKAIIGGDTFIDLRLRLLQMLYNSIESTIPLRVQVYIQILRFTSKHNIFHTIGPFVMKVDSWMRDWTMTKAERVEVYHLIAEQFDKMGRQTAYDFWRKRVECCDTPDLYTVPDHVEATCKFCVRSINSPDVLYYDKLIKLPAVRHLQHTQYNKVIDLINIFIKGGLGDLTQFIEKEEGLIKSLDLDIVSCREKIKLLTLVTICQDNVDVSLKEISEKLGINEEEAEEIVVGAITRGVMDGLIDQKNQKVVIKSVMHREFSRQQLELLHSNLLQWKSCIQQLTAVIGEH